MIFHETLATWLEVGERVEADDGYVGKAPLRSTEPAEKKATTKRVRSCQETEKKCSSRGVY